jgi:thiol-disulfide isomerase/thioredoxin
MEKIKNYIPIIVVVVIAVVLVAGSAIYMGKANTGKGGQLSSEEVGKKVIDYINTNILAGKATAVLSSTILENGLYKIKISINGQEIDTYSTTDGKLFFPEAINMSEGSGKAQEQSKTIGEFSVSADDNIIIENGKPVVYFFGSESCPHCKWEHPIFKKVVDNFKDQVVFHDNMDNTAADQEILAKFSDGGIPTIVIAGKYYRVGSGEQSGEEQEAKVLTAMLCKITNSTPSNVCDSVKDLVSQIQ